MDNRVILVTGANRGIGFEIVRQLAVMKHTVVLTSRDEAKGLEAVNKLHKMNLSAAYLRLDVTDAGQRQAAREKVEQLYGGLDVLINNAGVSIRGDNTLLDIRENTWSATMVTNAEAPLMMAQVFAPIMPKGSQIINISSGGGSMTDPVGGWSPVYCISKSALNAVTRHLAFHYSTLGISVNAVCPGWVKTDLGTSSAPLSVSEGADTAVWLATSQKTGSGKLWRERRVIPW